MQNISKYNNCKHGIEKPDYLHPKIEHILKETYGVIIYQEQVMQIAQSLSGFSASKADILRKAMGKKKSAEMERQKKDFKEPFIAREGDSIEDICNKLHRKLKSEFRYGLVWGKSVKFGGQNENGGPGSRHIAAINYYNSIT